MSDLTKTHVQIDWIPTANLPDHTTELDEKWKGGEAADAVSRLLRRLDFTPKAKPTPSLVGREFTSSDHADTMLWDLMGAFRDWGVDARGWTAPTADYFGVHEGCYIVVRGGRLSNYPCNLNGQATATADVVKAVAQSLWGDHVPEGFEQLLEFTFGPDEFIRISNE